LNKKLLVVLMAAISVILVVLIATEVGNSKAENGTYLEENTMLNNLKMDIKVLETAISKEQLSTTMYENVMKRLVAVEEVLTTGGSSEDNKTLLEVVDYSDRVIKSTIKDTNTEVLESRSKSLEALTSVQDKLGVAQTARRADGLLAEGGVVQLEGDKGNGGGTSGNTGTGRDYEAEVKEALKTVDQVAIPHESSDVEIISNAPKEEDTSK
jgi:hypothetical protein